MTFFISTYVIDTLSSHFVFEETICASAFVPTVSVDTFLVGFAAETLVKGTFVDVDTLAIEETVTLVTLWTFTVNVLRILRYAVCYFETSRVLELSTAVLDTAVTIAEVVIDALALKATCNVYTLGIITTVVFTGSTLVDVNTLETISEISRRTAA